MNKKFLILILSFLFVLSSANAFSIGISPSRLDLSNKEPGEVIEATFFLQNPNDFDINILYRKIGDVADWIEVEEISSIRKNSQGEIKVRVTIPDDALNKRYSGFLMFAGDSDEVEEGTGSTVSAAVAIRFNIGVSGDNVASVEIIDSILYRSMSDIEMDFFLKNTGNVNLNLEYKFEIWNIEKTEKFYEKNFDGEVITPNEEIFETFKFDISFLNPGEYVLIMYVYSNNDLLRRIEKNFSVYGEDFYLPIELIELNFIETANVGEEVEISALLKNKENEILNPYVVFRIYNSKNELIETIETQTITINPNETQIFETEFIFEESGIYNISARGFCNEFYSNELQSTIQITDFIVIHTRKAESVLLFYLLIFSALAIVIYMILTNEDDKKKKVKKK